jgi:hypothetical protein
MESQSQSDKPFYFTWGEDGKTIKLFELTQPLEKLQAVNRATGSNLYFNIAPNKVSVRDNYDRGDWGAFRPGEAVPYKLKDIIATCMEASNRSGIVRNIFDLMSDFTVKGINFVHPNERIEKFHKELYRRWNVPERSERFASILYRGANVVGKRNTTRLSDKDEQNLRRAIAAPDLEFESSLPKLAKREIPLRYDFFNPISVELIGDELAPFIGPESFRFAIRVPPEIIKKVKHPKNKAEREMIEALPDEMVQSIIKGEKLLPLDVDKVFAYYYKRDDWQPWAIPMLAPILKDLIMLEKLKLADISALDGAISCIRVWKLGNIEAKLMPSEAIMMRLAEILTNNVGGGVMDLVWGPDIELLETSTEVYRFLGEAKYAPTLDAIYAGLGIPPTLTGNVQTGFTNNYISLKTLVERLEYGRSILKRFWENELRIVQRAMGFRFPATVTYDDLLTDETAEKQLLLGLADRDLIDIESIQERFGLDPDIVAVRTRRDMRRRRDQAVPPKASPFHNPNFMQDMAKLFAGSGAYPPSQMGVELETAKPGEAPPLKVKQQYAPKGALPGEPGQGRPPGVRDKTKRKQKVVKPRSTAAFLQNLAIAEDTQAKIAKVVTPVYLKAKSKKNQRELTSEESKSFEDFKFALLAQFAVGQDASEECIKGLVAKELPVPPAMEQLLRMTVSRYTEVNGHEPSIDMVRRFQSNVYALFKGQYEETDNTGDIAQALSRAEEEPAPNA